MLLSRQVGQVSLSGEQRAKRTSSGICESSVANSRSAPAVLEDRATFEYFVASNPRHSANLDRSVPSMLSHSLSTVAAAATRDSARSRS